MAANLTPESLEAEREFKSARTTVEKVRALERMLSTIPRHKGTEKLQADLKRRLAKLRNEQARKPVSRAGMLQHVEREGVGQVVLVGPPNAGKSLLLARLTHAIPEVADYPFTTRSPMPGMMEFEDIQVQLVDLPPVHPDFPESWLYQIIRNADAALLVVDLSDPDLLEDLETTLAELQKARVQLGRDRARLTRLGLAGSPVTREQGGFGSQPRGPRNSQGTLRRAVPHPASFSRDRRGFGRVAPLDLPVARTGPRVHQGPW